MKISDLEFVIENPSGTYKKFADSLDEYPILGVTLPTHYGYIKGYTGEDGAELDVFIGNGDIFGCMRVRRPDAKGGIETKFLLGINRGELDEITEQYALVVNDVKLLSLDEFLEAVGPFKNEAN